MANIKKSFNFRNGVQVDEDNLLVTSTGLVAIGKTVPTEALDVIGNVIISGVTSSVFSQTGVLTVTSLEPTTIIGAGVSVVSGVVTSNSGSGIVTYYGDARFLQGMPTSQWEDTNAGFGVSSIYNTGGTVGIATTNPQSTLQIGDDPNNGQIGVGIASAGNIRASGIITANSFSGALTGNVTGNVTGNISGDVTGNLTGLINSAGISTFAGINATGRIVGAAVSNVIPFFYSNFSDLPSPVTYHGAFAHVHSTGRGYYAHGGAWIELVNKDTSGNVALGNDLDVDGHTNLDNVSVAGVTTFAGNIDVNADIDINGDVDVTGAITATNTITANQVIGTTLVSSDQLSARQATFGGSGGFLSAQNGLSAKNLRLATGGAGMTDSTITSVGTPLVIGPSPGGANTNLKGPVLIDGVNAQLTVAGSLFFFDPSQTIALGIGTLSAANDIQVRNSGNAEIQVTSDTGSASVTIGREPGTGNTNNAELRYGLVSTSSPYSSAQSLDIINYSTDNFNHFLSGNNPGGVNGDFHWHKGFNSATLMTLTGIGGSLGIGVTTPTTKLEVDGGAKFSGAVEITNTLTLGVPLNSNVVGNVTGNLTGNVTGNVNSTAGLSTIRNLFVNQGLGIGVTDSGNKVNIGSSLDNRIFINNDSQIGIKTDRISETNVVVEILGNVRLKKAVSVGDTTRSAVDFSDAVNITNEGETGLPFNRSQLAYMIPPRVNTTQRDQLRDAHTNSATLLSGSLIYNTSTNTIQVYDASSTSWSSLGSGGGGDVNQNAFSTIAVSGQSNVSADSTTDTLTLVAGSNVTITTDAGSDSVTINASGGGSGINNVVEDTSPQLGSDLDVQANKITTSTSNGNIKVEPNGSGVFEVRGAGGNDGTLQLNCSVQSHGIKLKSPPHSAGASYTLTFPNNIVSGQFLKTDGSGNLSWDSRLGAGFVNAADFGLDASATDGTNVTAINNAIAALGANGGTIFFPGGMFYLNAAIELTQAANENSLRFVGSGQQNYGGGSDTGGTVLRRDADDEFFNITNSRAIHFIGITFKGGAANGDGGNSGISGGNGAIYVLANAGCQGYLIENCVFHGIANCITFKGLSDSIIRGCRFRNVPSNEGAGACIKLDENGSEVIDQIRIQDCVLDGSPDGSALNANVDGIAIYNTVSTVYVTNTSAIRLKRSFYSDSTWDGNFFYFQNSEAERASSDGFSINGTGNFVTIDNCFSSTNNGHGINIGGSQNSSLNITNPNVRDNSGHGILIDGPTNNCSIVNPAIGGNSRGSSGSNHGIVIGSNANNVYITGGKIGGNTDELAGTGTQGYGIQINGNTHSNIRIIGTNVTGNATNSSEGITQNISSGTGNSIQFNAGSTVAINT